MLINGIDISTLGVILYDRVLNSNLVDTAEEWLDGDIKPTFIRQQDRFKNIKLTFLVLGLSEEDAFLKISKLTSMLKKSSVQFDDINLTFDLTMSGYAEPQRLKNGNFTVEYTFNGDYAKGEREIYTTDISKTSSFKLTILYYKDNNYLITTDTKTIRASSFVGNDTFTSIGINLDAYMPNYYNHGVASNMTNVELTYENLQNIGTLIINYAPIEYNLGVSYFMDAGTGIYEELINRTFSFTQKQLSQYSTIGQLVDTQTYKPNNYKATVYFEGALTVENILAQSPIHVYYDQIQNERSKNVTVLYWEENDDGEFEGLNNQVIAVRESDFYDGSMLSDFININGFRPNQMYYSTGSIVDHTASELVTYDTMELRYDVRYARNTNTIYVEYYIGEYPGWSRLATVAVSTKYKSSYETDFDITDLDIGLDRYHSAEYYNGAIYNSASLETYEDVLTAGVIQVFYTPIDYTISVKYYQDNTLGEPITDTVTINALDFLGNPTLNDIIPIADNKPEGYQLDLEQSYQGDITLSALLTASPITIVYSEIEAERTKNVIIRYKKELSSAYSTINTSLITINESDCVGGVRLRDIINLNLYKPEYYENGIVDGTTSTALLAYDDIDSNYNVLYMASSFSTPVKYYKDTVTSTNWIGSSMIDYKIIDFETSTTLFDLGLNLNEFKPSYCNDGVIQYNGAITFVALRQLNSIDIVYPIAQEPEDDSGIDYPHRFLFLQHNDLGDYEYLHPNWTMNHAYINTGVTAADMSKLTVIMECDRVDPLIPLHEVNAGYGYLFGSASPSGQFFMRFNNQTQYGSGLSGVNTYEAKAGYYSAQLTLTESSAVGFSETSGIYSSDRDGYSYATFTYTNSLQSEAVQMNYPLYLFANNSAGNYADGLAGIGIYGCRIYYDGELIRDLIPVQYYDIIGDQVAPSNCLYDKVTKTFFEDATGLNSFNIRDDERYEDENPDHKIGYCYVNFYKGDTFMESRAFYFRASDFIDKEYDPFEQWNIEGNQPSYYGPGEIQDYDQLIFNFLNMNHNTYTVVYPALDNQIVVNYYKEVSGENVLIESETIALGEKMFMSAPTFGDIVRLNKYKPDGYETYFQYNDTKVTLNRLMAHTPYDIVYTPIESEIVEYTTTIKYIKKVYGVRTYEDIDEVELTFDQSDFRDGEYIDFYIDWNLFKPALYYGDGEPYHWYVMDERLDSPENLQEEYVVVYMTTPQYLDINYFKNNVEPANLIASTTWEVRLDDFNPAYPFYIIDTLPNNFVNKYRPANCSGGVFEFPENEYTFFTLMGEGEINIIYEEIESPHDPTTAVYEHKVLYFGNPWDTTLHLSMTEIQQNLGSYFGARIPYIDLGYKPKDLGRLRTEITCYAKPFGVSAIANNFSVLNNDFSAFYGYWGAPTEAFSVKQYHQAAQVVLDEPVLANPYAVPNTISMFSKGCHAILPRIPETSGWVYTAEGPQFVDGEMYYTGGSGVGQVANHPLYVKPGIQAIHRTGLMFDTDIDYNPIVAFHNYGLSQNYVIDYNRLNYNYMTDYYMKSWNYEVYRHLNEEDKEDYLPPNAHNPMSNPFTVILDGYHKYVSSNTWMDSNYPFTTAYEDHDYSDNDIFEDREQPKGTLSLFRTTNPTTGKVNIMPWDFVSYNSVNAMYGGHGLALSAAAALLNPYNMQGENGFGITVTIESASGWKADPNKVNTPGEESNSSDMTAVNLVPIIQYKTKVVNINYMNFEFPSFPQIEACAIWGVKIYDEDRLVRDLIPVAAGDQIYDYTMPDNGLFDLVTEIFFGNSNEGGSYSYIDQNDAETTVTIRPQDVLPLRCVPDPLYYGKVTANYYDYNNTFIQNQFVDVPTWFDRRNTTIEDSLHFNDFKPDDFHLDGLLDLDVDLSFENITLAQVYEMGAINIYYKLRTFTKTIVYYRGNVRVGSRDLFFTLEDIRNASRLADLGIDADLFYDSKFKHGRIVFDDSILASDDIAEFIDAPSPIVVYDKLTKEEAPNLFYVEYYRGGASDDTLITLSDNPNYLDCDLTAKVINPHGAIKYYHHYHQALYEDESYDYFIPYQVKVINHYTGIHSGPGKMYPVLANIVVRDTFTIDEVRNGWGRLREYRNGWILLNQTYPMTGPGQNPDYDIPDQDTATIPFMEEIDISKLTIDRLWAYVPDVHSWIKTEDISYNQAGRLYNGLAIEVIDLDDIDFTQLDPSTVYNDWSLIGIDTEKYRMRYHNAGQLSLLGTNFTYYSLSYQHGLEIIYPETVYTYSCLYYYGIPFTGRSLSASFSCSISDWNPDWDVFIATSWQYDENDLPINPTLYRDTEIVLNWEYFGFDKDLFYGNGYGHGIYLWNPRTWDRHNVEFTFQELIRCGTQYVLYPTVTMDKYKLWIKRNRLSSTPVNLTVDNRHAYFLNPGIPIYLADGVDTTRNNLPKNFRADTTNGTYDLYFEGEFFQEDGLSWLGGNKTWYDATYQGSHNYATQTPEVSTSLVSAMMFPNTTLGYNRPIIMTPYGAFNGDPVMPVYVPGTNPTPFNHTMEEMRGYDIGDKYIVSISNGRVTPNVVLGFAKKDEDDFKYYYVKNDYSFVPIHRETNLTNGDGVITGSGVMDISDAYDDNLATNLITGVIEGPNGNRVALFSANVLTDSYNTVYGHSIGVIYAICSYEHGLLTHYWVPAARGEKFINPHNSYNKDILPYNCLFDLITCEYRHSPKHATDGYYYNTGYRYQGQNVAAYFEFDGVDNIYLMEDDIYTAPDKNLFDDWTFDYTETKLLVKINEDKILYHKPDLYAREIRTLASGTWVPINAYTSDALHGVEGEWYRTGEYWFTSSNTEQVAQSQFNAFELINEKMVRWYGSSSAITPLSQTHGISTTQVANITGYLYDTDFRSGADGLTKWYFDGSEWVAIRYTSKDTELLNKTYAVSVNYLNYYSIPLENNQYRLGRYQLGDRITCPYKVKDSYWAWTGEGWVRLDNNTSEVL